MKHQQVHHRNGLLVACDTPGAGGISH